MTMMMMNQEQRIMMIMIGFFLLMLVLDVCHAGYYDHVVMAGEEQQVASEEGEQSPPPYAIGWYFEDPNIALSNICETEINMIRSIIYETYYNVSIQDSNMTTDLTNAFAPKEESSPVVVESTTAMIGRRLRNARNLLSSSQPKPTTKVVCTPVCSDRPNLFLIYDGCSTTCSEHETTDAATLEEQLVLKKYYQQQRQHTNGNVGEVTKILYGQGAVTASTFYATVKELIPTWDPCRSTLLTMKYQRIPLHITTVTTP
jgi:hypothetical protein